MNMFKAKHNLIFYETHIIPFIITHNNNYIWACKGENGMNMFKAKHNLILYETHIIPFIITHNNNYIWAYKGANVMRMFKAKHILHFTEHIYFHLLLHNNNNYIWAYKGQMAWTCLRLNTIYTLWNTYNSIYYYTITIIIYEHVKRGKWNEHV